MRALTQREDLLPSEPVGDCLGRPARVARDGPARRLAARLLGVELERRTALAGAGQEIHDLREQRHRLLERHAPGVDAGIDAHPQIPVQPAAQLVQPLLRRVEALGRPGLRFREQRLRVQRPALRGHRVLPHGGGILHRAGRQPAQRRDLRPVLRHELVVPVVPGEALVGGEIRHRGVVVLLAQLRRVVPGRAHVEAPDATFLERRRRIVRATLDRGAQRRRRHRDFEAVVGRHVEEPGAARVLDQPLTGAAIALHHLRIRARRILGELREHRAHGLGPGAAGRPLVSRGDLLRERDHLVARLLDHGPRGLEQLRGRARQMQIVAQRPIVFALAERETVGPVLALERSHTARARILEESVRDEIAQPPVGFGRLVARRLQLVQQRVAMHATDVGGRDLPEGAAEVLGIGRGALETEGAQHAPVGRAVRGDARGELTARGSEIGRHRARTGDRRAPFPVGPAGCRSRRAHALNLPVDSAHRLVRVGIERAQLVAPHLMLVHEERDLGERHRAIDTPPRRESRRGERGEAGAEFAEPGVLLLQRLGRIVAQQPVDVRELRIEGRAPEVGGDHRELPQHVSHVLVLERRESPIAGMPHGQRLRRRRPRERARGAERDQRESARQQRRLHSTAVPMHGETLSCPSAGESTGGEAYAARAGPAKRCRRN